MINVREKGAKFERWVAKAFSEALGVDAKRGMQWRGGGDRADVTGVPGMHIECKVGAAPNVLAAYRQACADAEAGEVPVVVAKRDRQHPMVYLSLAHFLEIMAADGVQKEDRRTDAQDSDGRTVRKE